MKAKTTFNLKGFSVRNSLCRQRTLIHFQIQTVRGVESSLKQTTRWQQAVWFLTAKKEQAAITTHRILLRIKMLMNTAVMYILPRLHIRAISRWLQTVICIQTQECFWVWMILTFRICLKAEKVLQHRAFMPDTPKVSVKCQGRWTLLRSIIFCLVSLMTRCFLFCTIRGRQPNSISMCRNNLNLQKLLPIWALNFLLWMTVGSVRGIMTEQDSATGLLIRINFLTV